MTVINEEALKERANDLDAMGLNGLRQVLVTLHSDADPTEARLELHFHNNNKITDILNDFDSAPADQKKAVAKEIFPISGGHRITAGPGTDQLRAVSIAGNPGDNFLTVVVAPVGDYSTYTLSINYQDMDPVFSEIDFKFRPGCFNLCVPDWVPAPEPEEDPSIDYLAKDYDSFRHTMISAMMERVPGWQPTSEADLDQVLVDLFSAAADELSDYQDRVMNEAYLGTARKRVSLARHARLMDYHIHQGNQACTWLAVETGDGEVFELPAGFRVWTGENINDPSSVVFVSRKRKHVHYLLNQMGLYSWSGSIPALAAGSTSADLRLAAGGKAAADTVRNLIRNGTVTHLLIQERLNPATGKEAGRNPGKRQLLKLLSGDRGAETIQDPLFSDEWMVRVCWEERDKLRHNYYFTVDCLSGKVEDCSLFHGNLVEVFHGRLYENVFLQPGAHLTGKNEFYYEETGTWGTVCRLPAGPLAYKASPPGGEVPPESTLEVQVETAGGGRDPWEEVVDLVHSAGDDDHFVVETDEEMRSTIRFGNGTNGRELPEGAVVHCRYQVGRGPDGNIGSDRLRGIDQASFPGIIRCWNPFDVVNGRAPEPREEIIRRVPEAYSYRQLRAVTLRDYEKRAEELAGVSRASARYAWTGSWRTVRIAIDPAGTTVLTDELRKDIARYLDAVRLMGEDLEIRPPRFVPLEISVFLCIHPEYWPEDIKYILEQEFSDGFTLDGRRGFFHPDRWTFGQELRASQIIGRVQSVEGVDHVVSVSLKRWGEVTPGMEGIAEVRDNEIIQVRNDPDHMEKGFIFFDPKGGRK